MPWTLFLPGLLHTLGRADCSRGGWLFPCVCLKQARGEMLLFQVTWDWVSWTEMPVRTSPDCCSQVASLNVPHIMAQLSVEIQAKTSHGATWSSASNGLGTGEPQKLSTFWNSFFFRKKNGFSSFPELASQLSTTAVFFSYHEHWCSPVTEIPQTHLRKLRNTYFQYWTAGRLQAIKNTHKSARHSVHYASGHYQDLLFPRGTDKAGDSRDDFCKKDHAIVLKKLRKRTDWSWMDEQNFTKTGMICIPTICTKQVILNLLVQFHIPKTQADFPFWDTFQCNDCQHW